MYVMNRYMRGSLLSGKIAAAVEKCVIASSYFRNLIAITPSHMLRLNSSAWSSLRDFSARR